MKLFRLLISTCCILIASLAPLHAAECQYADTDASAR